MNQDAPQLISSNSHDAGPTSTTLLYLALTHGHISTFSDLPEAQKAQQAYFLLLTSDRPVVFEAQLLLELVTFSHMVWEYDLISLVFSFLLSFNHAIIQDPSLQGMGLCFSQPDHKKVMVIFACI